MIHRIIEDAVTKKFFGGKALIITGPRQVGKTTLVKSVLEGKDYLFLNCDDPVVRNLLTNINTVQLQSLIGSKKIIFIDEAQTVPNIGTTLKLVTDIFKEVQLIVSGSSSLDLANSLNEPLTGRKWQYELWPICWQELENNQGYLVAQQQLELRIVYGMYPDVINNKGEEKSVLQQLANSYLYKDLLSYGGIRKPEMLEKLLQALAWQTGSEVSYNELAQIAGLDKNTVSHYIDLLEKTFVIFRLKSFSRNLRNEIKTNQKIYFIDTGIRNAVIGNFTPLHQREDKGFLWENFLITERIKRNLYTNSFARPYFWRSTSQQEVDYVEVENNMVKGFEIKWNEQAKIKKPASFQNNYNTEIDVINSANFRGFLAI